METIHTLYGNVTVYINQLPYSSKTMFHVSFVIKKQLHTMLMHQEGQKWVFADAEKQPDWIVSLESELNDIIQQKMCWIKLDMLIAV